jgi:SAM-dependent methyltransferase
VALVLLVSICNEAGSNPLRRRHGSVRRFRAFRGLSREHSLLDISGGPGITARELLDRGVFTEATLTEFSASVCQAMADHLHGRIGGEPAGRAQAGNASRIPLDVRVLDLHAPPKDAWGPYDVVRLANCVYHCHDLPSLARFCRESLRQGGHLVLDSPVPSFGVLLKHYFEKYPPEIYYSPLALLRAFSEAGLQLVESSYRAHDDYVDVNAPRLRASDLQTPRALLGKLRQRIVFRTYELRNRRAVRQLSALQDNVRLVFKRP